MQAYMSERALRTPPSFFMGGAQPSDTHTPPLPDSSRLLPPGGSGEAGFASPSHVRELLHAGTRTVIYVIYTCG